MLESTPNVGAFGLLFLLLLLVLLLSLEEEEGEVDDLGSERAMGL